MSGSSGGCGQRTLVMARQAQISSLHAGGLGAEPPTTIARIIWLPLMTTGRPPELAKLPNEYWRIRRAARQYLVHRRLAGLARIDDGAGFHHRGVDRDLRLAVHAVYIDRLTELVVDNDAHPDALLDGFLNARLADGLGGRDVDLVLLHDHFGGVAADNELVAVVGSTGSDECRGRRRHQQSSVELHGFPPQVVYAPSQFCLIARAATTIATAERYCRQIDLFSSPLAESKGRRPGALAD